MKKVPFDELDYDYERMENIYEGRPFSGIAYENDSSGNYIEVTMANGVEYGPTKVFSRSGQLLEETDYQFGTQHGLSAEWYENGRKKQLSKFERGILVEKTGWDEDGNQSMYFQITASHPRYQQ